MNILHILQNSLPYVSGSTIRSKYIFKYQKKFANVFVFTTFYLKTDKNMEIINNIPYFRMNKRISPLLRFYTKWFLKVRALIFRFFSIDITNKILELPISLPVKSYVKKIVKTYKIDIIHQHSQSFIAKYTLEIAKKLNIHFVYEVRGFSEKSMLGNTKSWRTPNEKIIKFTFNKIKTRENNVLKNSDHVVTLSEPMRNILENSRKIDKNKITVVPNSIDEELLNLSKKEHDLKEKLSLKDCLVIGHFGRLRWYEGIETLLEALRILLDRQIKAKLIIIGGSDKKYLKYLEREIINKDISDNVSFLGHVPHVEIGKYYSITDIIVIPRNDISVCRIVTPLKPIDAMAFKTLVMGSDLPALRYTITPYETGILFQPEDPVDLANKISEYVLNPGLYQKIITNAYENVLRNFTWKKTVPRYEEIYKKLIFRKKPFSHKFLEVPRSIQMFTELSNRIKKEKERNKKWWL